MNYAGFPQSPYHALAQKYVNGNPPSLLTFGVKGGFQAGKDFYDALGLIKRLGEYWRCQVAGLPSGVHHPSPDAGGPNSAKPALRRKRSGSPSASSIATTSSPISIRRWRRRRSRPASRARCVRERRSAFWISRSAPPRQRRGAYRPRQQHAGRRLARDGIAIRPAVEGRLRRGGGAAILLFLRGNRTQRTGAGRAWREPMPAPRPSRMRAWTR